MDGASRSIAAVAQSASERARQGTEAADALTASFGTLVEGSAQMGLAVREIAVNASDATRVASEAVTVADRRQRDDPAAGLVLDRDR